MELTHKNKSREEALTIFQNLQSPLGLQFKLSDISADNNPAHAGDRNPGLFTSSRRCYVPRLQTQLFGKTSKEMQHLLLKITGHQDLAPKSYKVKSILEKIKQNGNCSLLFIQREKRKREKKRCLLHKEISHSPLKYLSLSLKRSISQDKINPSEMKTIICLQKQPNHTERS